MTDTPSSDELRQDKMAAPRPKYYDAAIAPLVVAKLLPSVMDWLKQNKCEDDQAGTRADLLRAVDPFLDGYKTARRLEERCHWECDGDLAERLDEASSEWSACHKDLVKRWVSADLIALDLSIGTPVVVTLRGSQLSGIVAALYPDTAEYCVRVPSLGHVESGTGTHGVILACEEVRRA